MGPAPPSPPPKPAPWVPERAWTELVQASLLPAFASLPAEFAANVDAWLKVYESNDPASFPIPGVDEQKYSQFHKLTILRCIRPDKTVKQVQLFVVEQVCTAPFVSCAAVC